MSQDFAPVGRARRPFLQTVALLGIIAGAGLLAWTLIVDDAGPVKKKAARSRRPPQLVGGAGPESMPASFPSSRPDEAVAVAPPPGSIRGKVVDRGEIPVNHATVRFVLKVPQGQRNFALVASFDETAKVDEEGKFSRLVPGGGIYQVVAEAEGFAPAIREGVKPGDEIELMLDVGASLAGTVVDRNTGRGVEAASIEVSVGKGAVTRKTETNAQGEFKVQELPAGKLTVSVEHPLYVPRTGIEQAAEAGDALTIRVELDPGKSIKGQVLAADDGRQIEGALVTVRKKKVRTDPAGRFVVRGLESEMHELRVAADGFQPDQRPINLSGSRVEAVAEIQLNRGATIRGRIQNEKGDPVAQAELKLFETWGNYSYEDWDTRHLDVKSGEDGTFKMTGIPGREWVTLSLRVRCKGYPDTFEKGIKLEKNDDEVFVAVTLRAGAVIAGRVVDQENRPVAGARIELRSQNTGGYWVQGETDPNLIVSGSGSDGEFRFEGLGASIYIVTAQARGFSSAWKPQLDLSSGSSLLNVLLSVEQGTPLKGFVVDPEEKPIAGANLNIWTNKGNGQAVSDAEGKFTVESLPKGPYDVWASALGFASTRMSKQMPTGDAGLRVVLKREAVLKGTVVDAQTKKPIEKFSAFLSNDDNKQQPWRQQRWGGQQSDPQGKFRVQAPQGTYRLEVLAHGYVRARKEGISLQPGTEPEPVAIEMKRGGAIEGMVRGLTGQPESGVQVYVGRDDAGGDFTGFAFSENDGYFFLGDLDSGLHSVVFQRQEAPLLTERGVNVGGDRPAFVEVQLETVAAIGFDFTAEQPKAEEDEETVVGSNGRGAAMAKPWRQPRVKVWIDSVGGSPLAVGQFWGGSEARFKPQTRKQIWVPQRREKFSIEVRDLPVGRYILTAQARGYQDTKIPFHIQRGARWRLPVEMKLLSEEERSALPEDSGRRRHTWMDQNGNNHVYWYYEDE